MLNEKDVTNKSEFPVTISDASESRLPIFSSRLFCWDDTSSEMMKPDAFSGLAVLGKNNRAARALTITRTIVVFDTKFNQHPNYSSGYEVQAGPGKIIVK